VILCGDMHQSFTDILVKWVFDNFPMFAISFYSAPQCSHCMRCTSYGNSVRLSDCRSVTRRHCVKTTERRMMQFACMHCQIAKCV